MSDQPLDEFSALELNFGFIRQAVETAQRNLACAAEHLALTQKRIDWLRRQRGRPPAQPQPLPANAIPFPGRMN